MGLEEILTPLVGEVKESEIPTPEEYDYWALRQNRTFVIDYEIMDDYALIELSKSIIQLNMAEKDIPKEELKPIYIYIYSYGGDLAQSFFFADLLTSSRIPVVTIATGIAMSGGFLILLAGHRRYAFKHAQTLVHAGSGAFQGTASEIEEAQKNYKKQIADMKDYVLSRTKIDEKLFNKNKNKDWYITGSDLTTLGVVDKLIDNFEDIQ